MITHSIGELKPLKCDECSYESTRADMLKRHLVSHSGEKLLKICKQCDYSFTDYRTLKRHLKKQHITSPTLKEQTARLESMKEEGKELRSVNSTTVGAEKIKHAKPYLVGANISETDVEMEAKRPYVSFNCKQCEFSCTNYTTLKNHMKDHDDCRPLNVDYSGTNASSLESHDLISHSKEKPFICQQCSFTCTQPGDLKKHMHIHNDRKRFSCTECNYKCKKADKLQRHHQRHHKNTYGVLKPYKCKQCNYKCTTAKKLRNHMLTHSQEKTFNCEECAMKYKQAESLYRHRKIHTVSGEKQFECNECNYKCTRADSFKRHRASHSQSEEKPFSCERCNFSSGSSFSMKLHMKDHRTTVKWEILG